MVGARLYDWMYRIWAPWETVGLPDSVVAGVERIDAVAERLGVQCGF